MPEKSITIEMVEITYRDGRRYHGGITMTEARKTAVAAGMNPASADFSIGNVRQMLNGAVYHRAMSVEQTRYYLQAIYDSENAPGLSRALDALRLHIEYRKTKGGGRQPGHVALLAEFAKLLSAPKGTSPPPTPATRTDLADTPEGSQVVDRALRTGFYFIRDPKVRAHVLRRAKGECECCAAAGLLLPDGRHYLETHHVIALSELGADTVWNVIAVCANHHREAHFGANAEEMENKFLLIVEQREREFQAARR